MTMRTTLRRDGMTSKQRLAAANRTATEENSTRRHGRDDRTRREDETQMSNAQERDDTRDAQARRPTRRCPRPGRHPSTRSNRRRTSSRNRNSPTRHHSHRSPHHRPPQEEIGRQHHHIYSNTNREERPEGTDKPRGVSSLTSFVYARPDANKPPIPPRTTLPIIPYEKTNQNTPPHAPTGNDPPNGTARRPANQRNATPRNEHPHHGTDTASPSYVSNTETGDETGTDGKQ